MQNLLAAVCLILIGIFVVGAAAALPVIEGGDTTIRDRTEYVISGSSFGSKPTAAPWKFDGFETGSLGAELSGWDLYGDAYPIYSQEYLRPSSSRSAKALFNGTSNTSMFGGAPAAGMERIFVDLWYLYEPADPASRNHKLFRLYPGDIPGSIPNLYFNVYCRPIDSSRLMSDGVNTGNYQTGTPWTWGQADRTWVHIQAYFRPSSTTADDGEAYMWIDCVKVVDEPNFRTRIEANPETWGSIWFGYYLSHTGAGSCPPSEGDSFTYWDDVYVDVTQARVELGDAPTYDSCTHREIQLPTQWSSTEITVTARGGSFSVGDELYLFVIDEDGNVSDGYQVTLVSESTPDTTAPTGVATLSVSHSSQTSATLTWTATGDDSTSGTATTYDLRYSTSTITPANWDAATQATGEPDPQPAGSEETFTVEGLDPETTYYFALKVADEVPNWSGLSNVASGETQPVPDTTPPADVTTLTVLTTTQTSADLEWTAVGDDGTTGTASAYDLRYSTSSITPANWNAATHASGEPDPQPAGSTETFTVTGLTPGTTYYFALKVGDEVDNWSGVSNVASDDTQPIPDATPPDPIDDLEGIVSTETTILLSWTAVGDDGTTGTASAYDLRYSTATITPANWGAATQVTGEPDPQAPGETETFSVEGLDPETTYYFAIKTADDAGNWSDLSNVASATTLTALDNTPPGEVDDLGAIPTGEFSVELAWTAVGDDGHSGTATAYDIRYSTSTIDSGNWSSATHVTGEPPPQPAGESEVFTVTGLYPNTTYYFALKVGDEVDNWSDLSNVAMAATRNITEPTGIDVTQRLADDDFIGADWEVHALLRGTSTIERSSIQRTGGNTGAFRQIDFQVGQTTDDEAVAVCLYRPTAWFPASQGPITALDVSLDVRALNGAPSRVAAVVHQVKTGEYFAWNATTSAGNPQWTTYAQSGLTGEDFDPLLPNQALHPDFDVGAGEIRFGFAVGQSAVLAEGVRYFRTGIDNWSMAVNVSSPGGEGESSDHSPVTQLCLRGNYPNPFNPQTRIDYDLPTESRVSLKVFDTSGRLVKTLVEAFLPSGQHSALWLATNDFGRRVPAGVYLYVLEANARVVRRKACLVD